MSPLLPILLNVCLSLNRLYMEDEEVKEVISPDKEVQPDKVLHNPIDLFNYSFKPFHLKLAIGQHKDNDVKLHGLWFNFKGFDVNRTYLTTDSESGHLFCDAMIDYEYYKHASGSSLFGGPEHYCQVAKILFNKISHFYPIIRNKLGLKKYKPEVYFHFSLDLKPIHILDESDGKAGESNIQYKINSALEDDEFASQLGNYAYSWTYSELIYKDTPAWLRVDKKHKDLFGPEEKNVNLQKFALGKVFELTKEKLADQFNKAAKIRKSSENKEEKVAAGVQMVYTAYKFNGPGVPVLADMAFEEALYRENSFMSIYDLSDKKRTQYARKCMVSRQYVCNAGTLNAQPCIVLSFEKKTGQKIKLQKYRQNFTIEEAHYEPFEINEGDIDYISEHFATHRDILADFYLKQGRYVAFSKLQEGEQFVKYLQSFRQWLEYVVCLAGNFKNSVMTDEGLIYYENDFKGKC